jgi:Leucyl aminopeptidase (aminopeptidase T)
MNSDLLRAFARVAVDGGLRLGPGDRLRILGDFPHRALMYEVVRLAYERGAALVRIEYDDRNLARIRVDASREEYLDEPPAIAARESEVLAREGWAYLRLLGEEDPSALEGADEGRLSRIQRARSVAVKELRVAQMSSRIPWCVMPAATDAWAERVLGPGATAGDLWRVLAPILRLGESEPAAALAEGMAEIERRCARLDGLALRELRFEGPGTSLRVRLSPASRWEGGREACPDGRLFMANIPTEESFTTPDYSGTEGYATLTRPARLLGAKVEGGFLRFERGVVVEARAERGGQALERYLETDQGSRRLGEVALVDSGNPIGRSGLVFDNALIDENAACHIALGSGYDTAFAGAAALSDEEKEARGFNVSLVHEDLMIGSPDIDVTGRDASGRDIPLMRSGNFVGF